MNATKDDPPKKYQFFYRGSFDEIYKGNIKKFSNLINIFLPNAEETLQKIDTSISELNFKAIHENTHNLKGMIGFFVDPNNPESIFALCDKIDKQAKTGKLSSIPEDFKKLKINIELLVKEIKKFISDFD